MKQNSNTKGNQLSDQECQAIWNEWCKAGYGKVMMLDIMRETAQVMEDSLIPCPNGIVLDGGCGTGAQFERILKKTQAGKIIGGDFSEGMLEAARKTSASLKEEDRKKIKITTLDLSKPFPFPDQSFDAEIFHISMNYVPYKGWIGTLKEAYRTLKTGGFCYVTTPLRGLDISKAQKKEMLLFLLKNPKAAWLAFKLRKGIAKINNLVKEGKITYPSEKELLSIQKEIGFQNVMITGRSYHENPVVSRAQKPQ